MKYEFNPAPFSVAEGNRAVEISQDLGDNPQSIFIDCDQIELFIRWVSEISEMANKEDDE